MVVSSAYSGKTVLVVGAGRSGIAAARFLLASGARIVLTDEKNTEVLRNDLKPLFDMKGYSGELILEVGGHRSMSFSECDFVVVSPGVPLTLPHFQICRKAGIPIIGEIELAGRHLNGKIIGITGSNGKTTTTTIVSELLVGAGLKGYAAGNIGSPLINFVSQSSPEDIYAVELSSFQLETIDKFRPFIGAILNLTPDHLDRYGDFEDYITAKRRIFVNQEKTDFAVLNADDDRTAAMVDTVRATPVMFSRRKTVDYGVFVRGSRLIFRSGEREKDLLSLSAIMLKGEHNLENVLAACTMAILAGAAPESLEETVRTFRGVEHRIERVSDLDGVEYFNDSKATNIDAAIKSLEAFAGNILLIAGGRDKGSDFTRLRSLVRNKVKHLVLIGEASAKIRTALSGVTEISEADSMQEAVSTCRRLAQPGDTVLLAPACSSFDMFRDYEERGRIYKDAVRYEISRRVPSAIDS